MTKEARACECGCNEMTKGGRFRPGHDSRMHGTKKQSEAVQVAMTIRAVGSTKKTPLEFTTNRVSAAGVRAGMLIKGLIAGGLDQDTKEVQGICSYVSPHGWVTLITPEGKQYIIGGSSGHGDPEIVEPAPKTDRLPQAQRLVLERVI
jgi:hypothetical protein